MPYRHTQRGPWIVIPCLAFAALDAVIAWRSGRWALVLVVVVLVAVAIAFSPLTVEVNESKLRWYFGLGFWSYRLPLREVETAAVVRNRWWYGWHQIGARLPLYNFSGLDEGELRLKSGDIGRIGTDDPLALAAALKSAAAGRPLICFR